MLEELRAQANQHPLDADLEMFNVAASRIEALEQEVERVKEITKIAFWHAYEYARMNPDYSRILPVWNRWKQAYPELDKQGE